MQDLSPIGWALRPLKRYAEFSGRSSRAEFWWFFLFTMIIYFVMLFAMGALGSGIASVNPGTALVTGTFSGFMIVVGLFWLALFVPMLAVQIRRLHDSNRSGWWLGGFWLLYVLYMGAAFSVVASVGQNPQTPPSMGGFAAVGVLGLAFFIYSIVLLVFFCLRGTPGPNRFGDDPYGANVEEVFA